MKLLFKKGLKNVTLVNPSLPHMTFGDNVAFYIKFT
jgi:hypothetical protein